MTVHSCKKGGIMARVKSEMKEQKIIAAAMELFAKKGYYYTNVKEIAAKADVGVGTVYIYFENKDEILIKIFKDFFNNVSSRINDILEKNIGAMEKFKLGLGVLIDRLSRNIDMARVFVVELNQSHQALSHLSPIIFKQYYRWMTALLEEAKDDNVMRDDVNVNIISISAFGILQALLSDWVTNKYSKEKLLNMQDIAIDYYIKGIERR